MNKRIYKYKLREIDEQTFTTHFGAQPLSVQYQDDDLVMWVALDADEPLTGKIRVIIIGTGNPANHAAGLNFLGTVQEPKRPLVWHIFWRTL